MIPRLALTSVRYPRSRVEWPGSDPESSHLFEPRKQFRKLRAVVDAEILDDEPADPEQLAQNQLLKVLLEHDLLRLWRYADAGPPSGTPSLDGRPDLFKGWAVVGRVDAARRIWQVVYEDEPGSYVSGGVMGNGGDLASRDTGCPVYADLLPETAARRRRADWLAVQVAAQGLDADLYVSERPYLHAAKWSVSHGTTTCTVRDALALVSLYLRAQDEFLVAPHHRFNRGLFFWVGTRELLPEAWRWFTACVRHSTGESDDSTMLLGGSLLHRVQNALETRDAVHIGLNRPQNNGTQQRALADLDTILLFLMAAIDISARVAHRVLQLPQGSEYRASWQASGRGAWLNSVRKQEPRLADVVGDGTPGNHALTILRLLRNSVHGAALQGTAFSAAGAPLESLVGLPERDEGKVLAGMDALGGHAAWGVRDARPGRVLLDPGIVVDRLFMHVIPLLNELMAKTPVERLPHARLTEADSGPPIDPKGRSFGDPFGAEYRRSIRWQLGF